MGLGSAGQLLVLQACTKGSAAGPLSAVKVDSHCEGQGLGWVQKGYGISCFGILTDDGLVSSGIIRPSKEDATVAIKAGNS